MSEVMEETQADQLQSIVEHDEAAASADEVVAHRADFPAMEVSPLPAGMASLQRFFDVTVNVSVELGRATLPIGELVKLHKGAVVELDRLISQPVELVAQGVRLARGEVVVVNDRYAIRIDAIEGADVPASPDARSTSKKPPPAPAKPQK